MKKQAGIGFIAYEIGDTIRVKGQDGLQKITDIFFIQSIKHQSAYFEVEINNCIRINSSDIINLKNENVSAI